MTSQIEMIETGQRKFSGHGEPREGDSVLVETFPDRQGWRMVVLIDDTRKEPYYVHQCGWLARDDFSGLKDEEK